MMIRFEPIWQLSRTKKQILSVFIDLSLVSFSLYLALWIRLGDTFDLITHELFLTAGVTGVITVVIFTKLGLYRAILRYLTAHALYIITLGSVMSAIVLAVTTYYFQQFMPRSVPVIYAGLLIISCGGARFIIRAMVSKTFNDDRINVLIYGAGSSGRQLAVALRASGKYKVRAFIDEDKTLTNTIIIGLQVKPIQEAQKLIEKYHIDQVLLAIPKASRARRKEVLEQLAELSVEVQTVPDMTDIVAGIASIDQLKEVPIEDLLGRDSVSPQQSLMEANIKNKIVMVTGAGGSIGSELCRQIAKYAPRKLVLFEVSEFALYQIDRELNATYSNIEIIPLLGSVQRFHRLVTTMQSFGVQTVYHAAAYKHVPMVEFNVIEGVRNNTFGTYYCAKAAIEAKVESFVLISTDKAVRPTNVMGATKRMAELALQALDDNCQLTNNMTRFCMVRFGNVLGSSGSVIPLFKRQISNGGPLTVTHPEITRYFMTIPEAAQLVIQAGAMAEGGDVFVLDMGHPVRITDLAEKLIKLSGLEVKTDDNPRGDIEIKYSGLRPGEKLFEELLIGDNVKQTAHERIMTAQEVYLPESDYNALLEQLDFACHNMDHEKIRQLLLDAPTGFKPTDGIGDLVWKQQSIEASNGE